MMSSAVLLNRLSMFTLPTGPLADSDSNMVTIRSAHGPKHRSTMASTYFRCKDGATAFLRIFHGSSSCNATPNPNKNSPASAIVPLMYLLP